LFTTDPEKWHFPLKAFIALTTVLRYRADCDYLLHKSDQIQLNFLQWRALHIIWKFVLKYKYTSIYAIQIDDVFSDNAIHPPADAVIAHYYHQSPPSPIAQ